MQLKISVAVFQMPSKIFKGCETYEKYKNKI
jgi:hypothetical protein